jgi:segregation and condensation protein A
MAHLHRLELDLDVFAGPFDLLLALILREELDLLEVELADIVVAYLDHLEARDELDLEAATEFLVLIAALLELKSRLMLPGEELLEELDELAPAEAAEELLQRMLQYARFRGAAEWLTGRRADEEGWLYRSAPPPPELRRVQATEKAYEPDVLGEALGGLLRTPAPLDLRHIRAPRVSLADRLAVLRGLLRRGASFSFDEAVEGADRVTVAITLFALLELYKRGEAGWEQGEPFGDITVSAA